MIEPLTNTNSATGYSFLVSRCENYLFYLATLMMFLCAADIVLTLEILSRGGIELNPMMDALIHRGLHMFVGFKVALTALSVILLVFRGDRSAFGVLKVGHFLSGLAAIYTLLVVYEISILLLAG